MEAIQNGSLGKVFTVYLERGELLLESLLAALERFGVKNAVLLGAIGSLQKVELHRVTSLSEKPEDEYITIDKPVEISSMQGLVLDGKAHMHMVVSSVEEAYTGHLENGTQVLYLVEMTIAELTDCQAVRIDKNGISALQKKISAK